MKLCAKSRAWNIGKSEIQKTIPSRCYPLRQLISGHAKKTKQKKLHREEKRNFYFLSLEILGRKSRGGRQIIVQKAGFIRGRFSCFPIIKLANSTVGIPSLSTSLLVKTNWGNSLHGGKIHMLALFIPKCCFCSHLDM